jgi:hypothetical protein
MAEQFFLHLVSDATGSTLHGLARACVAQFEDVQPIEKFWNLIRSEAQLDMVIEGIQEAPGPVLFTFVDQDMQRKLRNACRELNLPCVPVLEPIMRGLSSYLGKEVKNMPGIQHELNDAYFDRIEAVDFALSFDDGQNFDGIEDAEVILVGVSRTSKTPTCIYLANRGIRAANIPLVPGVNIDDNIFKLEGPLYIGLTENPERLAQLRRNRLSSGSEELDARYVENKYLDVELIKEEVRTARRLFSTHNWPVIDVTRRSVEETSAEILTLLSRRDKI